MKLPPFQRLSIVRDLPVHFGQGGASLKADDRNDGKPFTLEVSVKQSPLENLLVPVEPPDEWFTRARALMQKGRDVLREFAQLSDDMSLGFYPSLPPLLRAAADLVEGIVEAHIGLLNKAARGKPLSIREKTDIGQAVLEFSRRFETYYYGELKELKRRIQAGDTRVKIHTIARRLNHSPKVSDYKTFRDEMIRIMQQQACETVQQMAQTGRLSFHPAGEAVTSEFDLATWVPRKGESKPS